jgi:hypothetical protein
MNFNIQVKIRLLEINLVKLNKIFNNKKDYKNKKKNKIQAVNWVLIQIFQIINFIDKQNLLC